jgi:hypothetical protein
VVPIEHSVGGKIKCPDCGRPAAVAHAKDRLTDAPMSEPIRTAPLWFQVACECRGPRPGGIKLYERGTMVQPIP